MEPFLAIGNIFREKGHQVCCAFPEQFRNLAEDANMEFHSLGSSFIEMLESNTGKAALGGSSSGFRKFAANVKLARDSTAINKELLFKQQDIIEREVPDRILYNGKAIYPILWGLNNPGHNVLICPVPYMHYVRDKTHLAFNSNYGLLLNRLTFSLANFGMVTTTMLSKKWLKMDQSINRKQVKASLSSHKAVYTISPTLFPRPAYWSEHLSVLGYHEWKKSVDWKPDMKLLDFLGKHQRVLLVTFGSMTNPEPDVKTGIFIDILERNSIPTVINTASGGLVRPEGLDSPLIHFVNYIPYEWIFPRVYSVIHHGGSGTTHLGLKYGCATMIIPHILDQFVWNSRIAELGAGPKGIKASKISVQNLEPRIRDLVSNSNYKTSAEKLASQMAQENFREEIFEFIIN
jgi:UDP:flavonoid glycosyltransferase YjiC (YdhE family)